MTTKSELTGVYARALFDLASAADAVDAVGASLATVAEAITKNPALADALSDVTIPAEKKAAIMQEVFADVAPEALGIVLTLIVRGESKGVTALVAAFDELVKNERGIVVAEVTTASPLSDAVRAQLVEKLSAKVGKPVTVRERVDASLLGGIRINIAGRLLDGSLSTQLGAIRSALTSSSLGGEA